MDSIRHFQCLPTTYVTENKKPKTILICTFMSSTMSIVFASFKHLELPYSIKISATILQIVYICMTITSVNKSL